MANAQAEGDAPGPGRAAASGSGCRVERPPGEPATAVAVAVVHDPVVDTEEKLDAAAEDDDGEGGTLSCGSRYGSGVAAGRRHGDGRGNPRAGRGTAKGHTGGWARTT